MDAVSELWATLLQLVFSSQTTGLLRRWGSGFTNDDKLAEIINSIRLHGKGTEKYDNVRIGLNSRLDTIQAAILIEKLKIFPDELLARDRLATAYTDTLNDNVTTPTVVKGMTSTWAQYTLRVNDRRSLQADLTAAGIPSVVYYPKSLLSKLGTAIFKW